MIRLLSLFLLCLSLLGCSAEADTGTPIPVFSGTTEPFCEDQIIHGSDGAVSLFPMELPQVTGLRAFGDGLLLFSGESTATLTLVEGDNLTVSAEKTLSCPLVPEDPSLMIGADTLSFFDPDLRETVVLDWQLREIQRIRAPEELIGVPILSENRENLFYCAANALRVWNLQSGIRRTLTQMPCTEDTLVGLHMGGTIVQCRFEDTGDRPLRFLSAEDGRIVQEAQDLTLVTDDAHYWAAFPNGAVQSVVFGQTGQVPQALHLETCGAPAVILERQNAVIQVRLVSAGSLCFDAYDLDSGRRISSVTVPSQIPPIAMDGSHDGRVWILTEHPELRTVLYQWTPERLPCRDDRVYTQRYYTRDTPDLEGLARCREEARRIGDAYGIRIAVWEEAADIQPWDYDFESEYLVPVIQDGLRLLEKQLRIYPEAMLQQTASHFSSLTICLVRSITGSAESGSLEKATGIQFLDGTDACVVIALGEHAEQALYHELFHVMETHILTNSIAFDSWDQLNPAGFSYDYSYLTNSTRDSGVYLQSENRAFIDTYSMSYPKEDRARIMEYAILPGNKELFRSPVLQKKLAALCSGIREAYHLEDAPGIFAWEQYLK